MLKTPASFVRSLLLLSSGPLVWAIHFLLIYGLTGIVCARPGLQPEWLGIGILGWGIAMATIIAIGGILAIHLRIRRMRNDSADNDFIYRTSAWLGVLAGIAIVWEALPVLLVPACG
ncbi:hypothetical protein ACFQUU_21445 [Herbaspirillum sp. GCM10030257]|uniref:hypothetical protein n=1 Tax=Herbaspirillum sp. GCM10030257 TaxID=3273393 RepID=UPI003614F588